MEKNYVITFDTQFHLNNIRTMIELKATNVIIIRTPKSIKERWLENAIEAYKKIIKEIEPIELAEDEPLAITENYNILTDYLKSTNINFDKLIISLGSGHTGHNITLWKVFEHMINNTNKNVQCVYPDQVTKRFKIWQLEEKQIINSHFKPFIKQIDLETYFNISGYTKTPQQTLTYDQSKNGFNTLSLSNSLKIKKTQYENTNNGFGEYFEIFFVYQLIERINHHLKNKENLKTLEIGYSLKIFNLSNSQEPATAEYDLIMTDKYNNIYIAECKTGNAFNKKNIESQKKLADKIGCKFAIFAAITTKNNNTNNHDVHKSINVKTYFLDVNDLEWTEKQIDELLNYWSII